MNRKIMATYLVIMTVITVFAASMEAESNNGDRFSVMLYFHANGIMDTVAPSANNVPAQITDNKTFRINNTLYAALFVKNISAEIWAKRNLGGVGNVTVELYDNDVPIASKSFEVTSLRWALHKTILVENYTFAMGHLIKARVSITGGTINYDNAVYASGLRLEGRTITKIEINTSNARGVSTSYFYPNDWPYGVVNVSGRVVDVFGPNDIDSVRINISLENKTIVDEAAILMDNGTYYYVWNYTGEEIEAGTYNCTVTAYDLQGNSYNETISFAMMMEGLLLTSPSQAREGVGAAMGVVPYMGNKVYEIRVRNTGVDDLTVRLYLTGPDKNYGELSDTYINVSAGGYVAVHMRVNSTGKHAGEYVNITVYATATVAEATITTLTQVSPYSFSIVADTVNKTIAAGKNVTFLLRIINTGVEELGVELSTVVGAAASEDWRAELSDTSVIVPKNGEVSVSLIVSTPSELKDEFENATITVRGVCAQEQNITAYLNVTVFATRAVWIELLSADPVTNVSAKKAAEFHLLLHNVLNETKTFNLYVEGLSAGWETSFSPSTTVTVKGEDSEKITFRAMATLAIRAGEYGATITAVTTDTLYSAERRLTIVNAEYHNVTVELGVERVTLSPLQEYSINLTINNSGNVKENVKITVDVRRGGKSYNWSSVDRTAITLDMATSETVLISLHIPEDAEEGEYFLSIKVEYARHIIKNVTLTIERGFKAKIINAFHTNIVPIVLLLIMVGIVVTVRRRS